MSAPGDIANRKSRLSPAKKALLEQRLQGKRGAWAPRPAIPRLADHAAVPLSFTQQRLWFAHQWDAKVTTYNRPIALRLKGELDLPSLERSLNEVLRRHETLRMSFPAVDGLPVQRVSPIVHVTLPVEDLMYLPPEQRLGTAQQRMIEILREPFVLESGPLYRVRLFRLDTADHIFCLVTHHILFDGWSEVLFVNELCALYSSARANEPGTLPELPIQYADLACWQREQVRGEALQQQLAYWREELRGPLPVVDLPADRPRPPLQTYEGATESLVLGRALVAGLETVSRQEGVTLFMTLLAAFKVLVSRYTGQVDIIVGTPVAGRGRIETEKLIGPLVNTLALRTDLGGNPTFRELLQRIRQMCLGAYAHQDLPFDLLVAELNPERDLSRTPVFQLLFNLESFPDRARTAGELQVTPVDIDASVALFDLTVELVQRDSEIYCAFVYNTRLFDAATIQRLAGHFQTLLEGVVANPDQRLCDLSLLTEAERRQVLYTWNDVPSLSRPEGSLTRLLAAQAEVTPEATAVVSSGSSADRRPSLTYGELNRQANQVAEALRRSGVRPGRAVGLCVERSLDAVVGLLAIFKTGGVYVPVDLAYPRDRLDFVLRDANVAVVLTQRGLRNSLPAGGAPVLLLEEEYTSGRGTREVPAATGMDDPPDESPAYIIYTSGSTGLPKGVVVTYGALLRHCFSVREHYGLTAQDRVLQFASLSFDPSLEQILPTLLAGATVVLRGSERWSPAEFGQLVREHGITVANLPTAYWQELVCDWSAQGLASSPESADGEILQHPQTPLRLMICGGDTLRPEAARCWYATPWRSVRLLNAYGPTEAVVTATTFELSPEIQGATRVPIGRPLPGRRCYILDVQVLQHNRLSHHLEPVPTGVWGELFLGGDLLAQGYLNRPELTAECFVVDLFCPHATALGAPSARMYRTGDLARYLPDGNIEFLGRMDRQVKIRGYRVEPGEVETALAQHPAVLGSVVVAREDTPGDKRLVAYVVARETARLSRGDLQLFLRVRLPEYMLPSAFVFLDALPLTPSGKIDRRVLPPPDQKRPELEKAFVAPRTPVEVKLAGIWTQVLKLDRIGVHDNFFELGGHSLLATQVVSRIRATFHMELPLRTIFETSTIAALSSLIEQIQSKPGRTESAGSDTAEAREELVL